MHLKIGHGHEESLNKGAYVVPTAMEILIWSCEKIIRR